MKIRNGFVSNSSSSSFLVLFPKKVGSYDELFNLMWTEKNIQSIQDSWEFKTNSNIVKKSYNAVNETFPEFQKWATTLVLREIREQDANNYLRAISLLSGSDGWYDEQKNSFFIKDLEFKTIKDIDNYIKKYNDLDQKLDNFDWNLYTNEYYEILENAKSDLYWVNSINTSLEEIKDALDKYKNSIFYSFSFSDEDGTYFTIMEHGGVFGDLPVYVESFH